jgi:hypothetical protein
MKGRKLSIDKEEGANDWGDDAFFCDTCDKPFRYPQFDTAKEFERTIFNSDLPEVEIVNSEGIGQYCSSSCRDQARSDLLQRENVRATYPDIGPIEFCSRCSAPVDMTKFHLAYVESVFDGEWDRMSVNVLEATVVAILCNVCSAPPDRLIAEVDFPISDTA